MASISSLLMSCPPTPAFALRSLAMAARRSANGWRAFSRSSSAPRAFRHRHFSLGGELARQFIRARVADLKIYSFASFEMYETNFRGRSTPAYPVSIKPKPSGPALPGLRWATACG